MNTSRLLAGFCVALLSVVILWGGNGAQSDQPPEQWYVSNEVLIVFSSAYRPAAASLSCVNGRFGVREVDSVLAVLGPNRIRKVIPFANERHSGVGETLERTYTFHYDSDIAPPVLAAQLSRLPYFDDVRVNHLFHREYHGTRRFHVSDTTYFAEQWNLDSNVDSIDIDAPEAWAIQQGSSEVILCIIDSGTMLDTTDSPWQIHSDFHYHWISEEDSSTVGELSWEDVLEMDDDNGDDIDDNIIGHNWDPPANHHTEQQLAFWRAIPNNYQIYPDTGWGVTKLRLHGLWVASIAAAALEDTNYVGVAHNCEVYILRDGRKTVNEGELIEMLDHASTTASVINMSWGIHEPDDSITAGMNQAILRAAQDHDCVLVASAGNDESSSLVSWPARNPNVLGVGSIGRNLAWEYYSNYGAEGDIDVVAIGDTLKVDSSTECADISGFPRCPTDLEEKRDSTGYGTSFAAPQAAGVAALIRSQFPSLTQDEVRDRIKRSSIFYWA